MNDNALKAWDDCLPEELTPLISCTKYIEYMSLLS